MKEVTCKNCGNYWLTEGKTYKVISEDLLERERDKYGDMLGYTIKNDIGGLYTYPIYFFETIQESRKRKLKKLSNFKNNL